jgi:hypothetical protein
MFFKRAKKAEEAPAAAEAAIAAPQRPSAPLPLAAEKLRRETDAAKLGFKSTADVTRTAAEPFEARRVWEAIDTALSPQAGRPSRNVLVTAPPSCAASRAVAARLATLPHAVDASAPDWLLLRGDTTSGSWIAVTVPAGQGKRFVAGMEAVIAQLRRTLPYLLAGEDLARRRADIEAGYAAIRDDAFARLHGTAHAQNVAVLTTPMGFAVAPMHEGKVVKPEVIARLPQAMRDDVRRKVESVEAELQTLLSEVPSEAGSRVAELSELVADYVRPAVAAGFEGLLKEFSSVAPVMGFLSATQEDVIRRACRDGATLALPDYTGRVIEGAGKLPVTLEPPLSSDALAHALLRAGKGAVLIDAADLDAISGGWSALKSALQSRTVTLSDLPAQPLTFASCVVLVQDTRQAERRRIDDALASAFPVTAAFASDAARNDDSEGAFARMLAAAAEQRGLLPLEAGAVAQLVNEAACHAGRPDRLSSDLTQPLALAADAGRIAAKAGRTAITVADVQTARAERHALARIQPLFPPAAAAVVGRVVALGLAAEPVEVWATVRPGRGTVGDIARAAPNGGDNASSAPALLWSLLATRCPLTQPLSVAAAVVHEPPIAAVAAVRASVAEVGALLSALADVPVATTFAAAGWVSPSGALLPAADINAAIEAAFDYLGGRETAGGLNIVIPRANEAGLMLRAEVAEAARKGRLHIYTAADVEEALAILTGLPFAAQGDAEPGLSRRIEDRLATFARQFAAGEAAVRPVGKGTAS